MLRSTDDTPLPDPPPLHKTCIGGLLMGIANLIPGVSGGTMILAVGIYTEFIDSVADVSVLRLSRRRILFLGAVGVCALVGIKGFAPVILYLLFHHTTAMYALFIGMTLGGAPLLWRSLAKGGAGWYVAIAIGFLIMVAIASARRTDGLPEGRLVDVVVGCVAAVTMVLPGISGSYMLLIMGQYERVVQSVRDMNFSIIIPVGIGVVLGVVLLSNALKFLLHRYERATIGFLLGMLLGSVISLWPFGQKPSPDALAGRDDTELITYAAAHGIDGVDGLGGEELATHILAGWDDRSEDPYSGRHVAEALAMVVLGFGMTFMLARKGEVLSR
jgi:putative membrane protein